MTSEQNETLLQKRLNNNNQTNDSNLTTFGVHFHLKKKKKNMQLP